MQPDSAALDKIISANKLHPLMSNTKWVKLLSQLIQHCQLLRECRVKLIWEDESVQRHLVLDEHTSYNLDYYATSMEAMITGKPRGWYEYKEIEWLDFPRFVTQVSAEQNLEAIQEKIVEVGMFKTELTTNNLRLYAYQRP